MSKLVLINNASVKLVTLGERPLTIGRNAHCDIAVDRPLISRVHAAVTPAKGGFMVCDLDSSNGTFVNGKNVRQAMLRHQDVIRIGDCEMRFLHERVSADTDYPLTLAA